MTIEDVYDKVEKAFVQAFHSHLDECKRCANNPFDLCPTGATALRMAVTTRPLPK